jgi:hypothetical protein
MINNFTTMRGLSMRKLRTAVALAASLALAGCQTLDGVTVNGVDVNKEVEEAQAGPFGNCGVICLAAIAAGVIIGSALIFDWPFSFDDDDDDNDTTE